MKIGDIVICIKEGSTRQDKVIGRPEPKLNREYKINDVLFCFGETYLGFEEMHQDSAFASENFRERNEVLSEIELNELTEVLKPELV